MTPAELQAHIDTEARKPPARDSLFTRAAEACKHVSGPGRVACQSQQFAALYIETDLDERAVHEAMRDHARQVASRGDARSLIAAAEIMPVGTASSTGGERTSGLGRSREAIEWIVRAQRLGRDDALVQWSVAAFQHRGADGHSPDLRRAQLAAVRRLPVLEPDNAAAFLVEVSYREDGSIALPTPAQLQKAAALPRFSEPVAARIALGLDALRGVPALPAFRRVALRANREHDTATHCASHDDLVQQMFLAERRVFWSMRLPTSPNFACSPKEIDSAGPTGDACLQLFQKIHDAAQTLSGRGVAASIASLSTTPERRAHWRSMGRREYWQSSQYAALQRSADPYEVARFAAQGWRSGSEIHGMEALLRSRGIPLDPPDDWKMPGEP